LVVKKQRHGTEATWPMPSYLHPSCADKVNPIIATFSTFQDPCTDRVRALPTPRQANNAQARCMLCTCWHMPGAC